MRLPRRIRFIAAFAALPVALSVGLLAPTATAQTVTPASTDSSVGSAAKAKPSAKVSWKDTKTKSTATVTNTGNVTLVIKFRHATAGKNGTTGITHTAKTIKVKPGKSAKLSVAKSNGHPMWVTMSYKSGKKTVTKQVGKVRLSKYDTSYGSHTLYYASGCGVVTTINLSGEKLGYDATIDYPSDQVSIGFVLKSGTYRTLSVKPGGVVSFEVNDFDGNIIDQAEASPRKC